MSYLWAQKPSLSYSFQSKFINGFINNDLLAVGKPQWGVFSWFKSYIGLWYTRSWTHVRTLWSTLDWDQAYSLAIGLSRLIQVSIEIITQLLYVCNEWLHYIVAVESDSAGSPLFTFCSGQPTTHVTKILCAKKWRILYWLCGSYAEHFWYLFSIFCLSVQVILEMITQLPSHANLCHVLIFQKFEPQNLTGECCWD